MKASVYQSVAEKQCFVSFVSFCFRCGFFSRNLGFSALRNSYAAKHGLHSAVVRRQKRGGGYVQKRA